MPKYIRIDERLIHGQILQKWLEYTCCNIIYVIDDEVAEDPITQSVLAMTVPAKVQVEFLDERSGAKRIRETKDTVMILLKSLETLQRLFELGVRTERVNVCRLPYAPGKKIICQNLFISDREEEILRRIIREGIDVCIQTVPDNDEIHMKDLLPERAEGRRGAWREEQN